MLTCFFFWLSIGLNSGLASRQNACDLYNDSSSNSNNNINVSNDSRDIYYRADDASPGWGSNFPRVVPQGGEATSPG